MKNLIYYIIIFSTLIMGCSKTEERVELITTKPFIFDEMVLENKGSNSISISSKLLGINQDKITDYGILVEYTQMGETNEEKISIGTEPKPGPIHYEYKAKTPFKVGTTYYVQFYIQTAKGIYTSKKLPFTSYNLEVTERDYKYARANDTISVHGVFDGIDNDFLLKSSLDNVSIPFAINKEKNLLTFVVPKNTLNHGAEIDFNLFKKMSINESFNFNLCRAIIVAKLNAPLERKVYLSDAINFTGTNLPGIYSYNEELWLLIGGQKFKFQSPISIQIINGLKGTKFEIGYLSGNDTIMFPDPIELIIPEGNMIHIPNKVVHPSSISVITGNNFDKFYGNGWNTIYIGSQMVKNQSYYDRGFSFTVPQMQDGIYTVTISNPYFKITSLETLEVRKLKITDISTTTFYNGDKITIKGNFIDYNNYNVLVGDHIYYTSALNGEITFENTLEFSGTKTVSVQSGGNKADKVYNIKYEKGFINSMSQTVGYPGDVVTVKGKGFSALGTYKLGDTPIIVLSRNSNEFKFLIPSNFPKGKGQLTIDMGNYILKSEDYLEVR